jgi:transposase
MPKVKKRKTIIKPETMIVAIDIGKDNNWAIFRAFGYHDSKPFVFKTTKAGFDNFYDRLRWYKAHYNTDDVVVGFESTGVYADPLIHYLKARGIRLILVNAVHTKRVKEIRDNSPNKTDKKDPRVIADIIQLGCFLNVIVPKGDAAELRQLIHARERAIGFRDALLNQLHTFVYKIFPEFNQVFKSLKGKTAQSLLRLHPLPEDIAAMDTEVLISTIRTLSRGRIQAKKVKILQMLAQNTVGIKEGQRALVREIRHLVAQVRSQQQYISHIEKDISEILKTIPISKRMLSIKGIGEIITAGILGETANFEGLNSSKEIEKLAGLNLFEISSGKHKGQKRISKRGRSLLRKLLYFAALNVIKHDGVFRDKYQSYLSRGKPKNQALIAIARKLIRVIFTLIRKDVNFNSDYQRTDKYAKAA